jgi:hypothetical protein
MGRAQVEKGKRWEREVARRMREAMPDVDVRRGYQRYGADQADVEVPVLWIECKVGKKPNVRAALEQAGGDAPPGRVPVAVVKDDGGRPFVAMGLDDFLDFVGEWWARR